MFNTLFHFSPPGIGQDLIIFINLCIVVIKAIKTRMIICVLGWLARDMTHAIKYHWTKGNLFDQPVFDKLSVCVHIVISLGSIPSTHIFTMLLIAFMTTRIKVSQMIKIWLVPGIPKWNTVCSFKQIYCTHSLF